MIMKTKQDLEQMFYKEFGLINSDDDVIVAKSKDVRNFIFETIIPEVLKSIMPGDNMLSGMANLKYIKQKAKELYGIDL